MKISCLVVDDVALNRRAMTDLIEGIEAFEAAGECSSAEETKAVLTELEPDVMFLDIEMPGMSGMELLKSIPDPPLTVITTSHREFAAEGYELNVFDFLVKPISRERFQKCADKILEYFREKKKPALGDQFFLKEGNRYVRIRYDEVKYIESMRDFLTIHLDKSKYGIAQSLKSFCAKLPADQFLRVHRSYIVPIRRIESIEGNYLRIQELRIPIGDVYRKVVMKTLLGFTY